MIYIFAASLLSDVLSDHIPQDACPLNGFALVQCAFSLPPSGSLDASWPLMSPIPLQSTVLSLLCHFTALAFVLSVSGHRLQDARPLRGLHLDPFHLQFITQRIHCRFVTGLDWVYYAFSSPPARCLTSSPFCL
jgi:hypothetical protein